MRFDASDRAVTSFMRTMPPVSMARNVEELAHLALIHSKISLTENDAIEW